MEKLTDQMAEVTVKNVAFATKKPAGSLGEKLEIKTNLSKITLKANIPYYKYDLRMYALFAKKNGGTAEKELSKQTKDDFPEQERKTATMAIFKKLLEKEKGFFGDGKTVTVFYDRVAILFSLKQLKLTEEEKVWNLPGNFISGFEDAVGFKAVLKKCAESFQTNTNDLSKVVSERASQADKCLLEALNLIVGQTALMKTNEFITYGNGTHYLYDPYQHGFKSAELPALKDGKYMGAGASTAVKVLEGGNKEKATAYVAVDVKKTAFHADDQDLLDKLLSILNVRIFSVDVANRSQKAVKDQFQGLYVETNYGERKRRFKIDGIAESASQKRFNLENGQTITVASYFQEKYSVKLKYPDLFMVFTRGRRGADLCYPIECLRVAASQRVGKTQQTAEQNSTTIKACATLPAERLRQTETMKQALGLNKENRMIIDAGLTIDDKLAVVPGRIMPAPSLQFGNKKILQPVNNCKWNSFATTFFSAKGVQNWTVCGLFLPNDARSFEFDGFVRKLVERSRAKGMKVGEPTKKKFDRVSESVVVSVIAEAKEAAHQFVVFVSSDAIKLHDFIKLTEVKMQVLTQEMKVSTARGVVEKRQNNTLDNIISKFNTKLGGLSTWVLVGNSAATHACISSPTRLIIGLEMSHPAPLSKAEISRGAAYRMPSVLGWGANTLPLAQEYKGDYRYVAPRQSDSMGAELRTLIKKLAMEARENRGKPPQHLVFYFNGISEGQWALLASDYMLSIRAGLADINAGYKPKMTAIAVSKEHQGRFFNKNITGTRAAEQNISPGTVIDSVIVSPLVSEVFLNSHSAFQGTAKTPKYSVIYDDSGMKMDDLESMTHGLCFQHGIVDSTVSLPAPLMVADRCAKRGHNVYIAQRGSSTGGEMDLATANLELTNDGKKLGKTRYNA